MPPVRICGVTRVSTVCHVSRLGFSIVLLMARAHEPSSRNAFESTPSYLTTWLCPPNLSKLLKRALSAPPSSALLRCGPTGPLPGSPKNDAVMRWLAEASNVPFAEYEMNLRSRRTSPWDRSGHWNAPPAVVLSGAIVHFLSH